MGCNVACDDAGWRGTPLFLLHTDHPYSISLFELLQCHSLSLLFSFSQTHWPVCHNRTDHRQHREKSHRICGLSYHPLSFKCPRQADRICYNTSTFCFKCVSATGSQQDQHLPSLSNCHFCIHVHCTITTIHPHWPASIPRAATTTDWMWFCGKHRRCFCALTPGHIVKQIYF